MNPHRKGNAFPQAGVPGDPRLLDQLHRQMVRGPNMQITHTHSGTLINPKAPKIRRVQKFQFQVFVRGLEIVAFPGSFVGSSIDEVVEVEPIDGDWYLYGKLTINETTGAITTQEVLWGQSIPDDTATIFYTGIAFINVDGGVPDPTSIEQYNYGPILGLVAGGIVNKWITYFV
jgi:hypothetical protein